MRRQAQGGLPARRVRRIFKAPFGVLQAENNRTDPARIPDDPSKAQIDSALADEGKRILQLIHQSARVYAMCIEGKQLSSEELSRDIEQAAVGGSGNLVFIIGGSHGLTDEVKRRANFKLSMSKMTFPHQLARVMLLEQIYRAFMISSGGKYHK